MKIVKIRFAFAIIFVIFLGVMYINSTTSLRLKLANHYIKTKKYNKAIITYKKILRKETLNIKSRISNIKRISDIHLALANLLLINNRFIESAQLLGQLIEINPTYKLSSLADVENPLRSYLLGLIYQEKNKDSDAVRQFKKSLDKINKLSSSTISILPTYLSDIYYRLAINSEKNGDIEDAVQYYKKAIELKDNEFIEAYYYLISLYTQKNNLNEKDNIGKKLLNLNPQYQVDYKFSDNLILLGYSFNEKEFELFKGGKIVFFWKVVNQNFNLSYEKKGMDSVYKIGDRLYEIKKIMNLTPNFGFEVGSLDKGFPYGWGTDVYNSPTNSHEIVSKINSLTDINQCLLLDNMKARNTNCQTDYIAIEEKSFYLQAGWIKSTNGGAYVGRGWFDSERNALGYDYVVQNVQMSDWKYYSEVFMPMAGNAYCRLWAINWDNNGKAYFDNIIFIKLDLPQIR